MMIEILVGGFNPSEKTWSNWILSPSRGEHIKSETTTLEIALRIGPRKHGPTHSKVWPARFCEQNHRKLMEDIPQWLKHCLKHCNLYQSMRLLNG